MKDIPLKNQTRLELAEAPREKEQKIIVEEYDYAEVLDLVGTTHIRQELCSPGYYCLGGVRQHDSRNISAQVPCPLGTYQDNQGQTQCKGCNEDQYQDEEGASSCKSVSRGSYAKTASVICNINGCGVSTNPCKHADGTCSVRNIRQDKCEKGHYCKNGKMFICPPGKYSSESGSIFCTSCQGIDMFSTGAASSCSKVRRGYYSIPASQQELNNRQAELICEPGYYCVEGARIPCELGKYQLNEGKTECLSIEKGYFGGL